MRMLEFFKHEFIKFEFMNFYYRPIETFFKIEFRRIARLLPAKTRYL